MKLASFLAISATLHAAALFYPAPFASRLHEELIPVTVAETEELGDAPGASETAKSAEISNSSRPTGSERSGGAIFFRPGPTRVAKADARAASTGLQTAGEAAQSPAAQTGEPEQHPARPENPSAPLETDPPGANVAFPSWTGTAGAGLPGSGLGGGQGQGSSGAGQGRGVGSGGGVSHGDSRLTQARYKETPKPLYPERARKEGQQGRVLLRVLVDQEGKSKTVEISGSSGSEALDRAAVDAIRLWRFSPARYGDKPVESWVRVPIDFRLTDREK